MTPALSFNILLLTGAVLLLFPPALARGNKQYNRVLQSSFARHRQVEGNYEYIRGDQGVVTLLRVVNDTKHSLSLLEMTNGSTIIQLVLTQESHLSDCDISTSRQQIHRLLKRVTSRYYQVSFVSVSDMESDFKQEHRSIINKNFTNWTNECYRLDTKEIGLIVNNTAVIESAPDAAVIRNMPAKQLENQKTRSKRGFNDITYPGTNWCGLGNSSQGIDDLGEYEYTDSCCRTHDHCPYVIPALSTEYYYFNHRFVTVSHCDCDTQFKSCLSEASTDYGEGLANFIGSIYFNVMGIDCFTFKEEQLCTEESFWGRCLKKETVTKAVFEESLSY
ncbi:uncharacterized protein [Watersipora subatra]|uniref:uncharacterized protein n=1 Tax=Watersipora subatra TaxID=2589382 RepID=UPI00355C10EE